MTERMLTERVAVITGAGRGLGRGNALAFAAEGCAIVVVDRPGPDGGSPASDVAAEIVAAGGDAIGVDADVTSQDQTEQVVATALDRWGSVDIVVNNAAIQRPSLSWEQSVDEFRSVADVNLVGTFAMVRAVLPHMREQGRGRIINVTSRGALGHPLQSAYSASKAGVIGLTYAASLELEGSGVTINAFGPSGLTRMASAAIGLTDDELRSAPVLGSPFLIFLASDAAGDFNGQLFMQTPAGVELFGSLAPVAQLRKPEGEPWWTPQELGAAFVEEFVPRLARPGFLDAAGNAVYVEKISKAVASGSFPG